ncbi:MAG: Lipoyl synthase [Chloroflexi bacterium]|nr:Lipoyl synthase [Chloroflexota bacterium]
MPKAPVRDRVNPAEIDTTPKRRPPWIRVQLERGKNYSETKDLVHAKALHTVCQEAMCPNQGECWGSGTATFMILGDVCTRACKFCDVKHGRPQSLDWDEPERVAQAVREMGLEHAVITSVNRDERPDGGAPIFAHLIRRIRDLQPGCTVEVLIPDFQGSLEALKMVMDARPDVLNHNVETVPQLFEDVQTQSKYAYSRATLVNAKKLAPGVLTKSGLMVGLGETTPQIKNTMRDLRAWEVDILTIGQYLQPSRRHYPIMRYYRPEEFSALKEYGLEIGFKWVESAPLVRSSYRAGESVKELRRENGS